MHKQVLDAFVIGKSQQQQYILKDVLFARYPESINDD